MSAPLRQTSVRFTASDSPWFWALLFSTGAFVALALIAPQYAQRQRRLEMQFQARREVTRRQMAGERVARAPGSEGEAPPPALGELIIPLWPLALAAASFTAVSAAMFWRDRRRALFANEHPEGGPAKKGSA
jgi:hypothetical protein